MKTLKIFVLLAVLSPPAAVAEQEQANPLAKVFDLISKLKQQIVADGEREEQAYTKFVDHCRNTAANVQHEIDTGSTSESKLESKTRALASDIEVGDSKIKSLADSISKQEAELTGAVSLRKKEAEEFAEAEQALMGTIDTLERALSMLEKQLSAGKSFAQIDTSVLTNVVQTLSVVDQAASLDGESLDKLTAFLQDQDEEEENGAPKEAAYKKQSGGIMEVLEDMKDKAEGQLSDLRSNEMKAKNSFALLKQGLEDEIKATQKELDDEKSDKSQDSEEKASAEGNLQVTKKEVISSKNKNDEVQSNCQTIAGDHEANTAARKEELKVIDEAERILRESTGAGAASFLQVASHSGLSQRLKAQQVASSSLIRAVQQLAKQHHSASLAQLASRISAELKYAASRQSADPFKKVKGLITSMINKLEKEASDEAQEKEYCDSEMKKTADKKSELDDTVSKLVAKIDKAASKTAQLREEVAELTSELSVLTKEQASMDGLRREEHAAYTATKADLEQGLTGVRKALSVLQGFYGASSKAVGLLQEDEDGDQDEMSSLMQQASRQPQPPQNHAKSTGAGQGIISILEVVESDMAKNLATEDAEESDKQSTYDKQTQTNKLTKAEKEQDIKFKTQEYKSLDKSIAEMEADKATEMDELTAVNEYFRKIKERCVAKPTSYEELKARREAEIQGLKDAMASLESSALMQMSARHRRGSLRGESLRVDSDSE